MERFALRLRLHGIRHGVIYDCALFKKSLEKEGTECSLVKGFCVIEDTREACEHYWVRTKEGLDLDIGFTVAAMQSPELMALKPVLLESLPPGLTRSDTEAHQILQENCRLFELYQSDQKAFWREAPKPVGMFVVK
jgi:hypothetical protein